MMSRKYTLGEVAKLFPGFVTVYAHNSNTSLTFNAGVDLGVFSRMRVWRITPIEAYCVEVELADEYSDESQEVTVVITKKEESVSNDRDAQGGEESQPEVQVGEESEDCI